MSIEKLEVLTEVLASSLFLISKFFLWPKEDKMNIIGWVTTLVGAFFFIAYVRCLVVKHPELNYLALEVYGYSTVVLSTYALATFSKRLTRLKKLSVSIKALVLLLTTIICFFIIYNADRVNVSMLLQATIVISGLVGTLMLALKARWYRVIGWISYIIAHGVSIAVVLPVDGGFYAAAQVISIGVAVFAIWKIAKGKEKEKE